MNNKVINILIYYYYNYQRLNQFNYKIYFLLTGPEEECMEFVCHAPSDYYKSRNAPYLTSSLRTDLAYIWTNIGPQIINTPTTDEVFGSGEEMGDIKLE